MDPVALSVTIARPREEVFEYLADVANRAEYLDRFLTDWHLTREVSYGRGAGARFRVKQRGNRFGWGDVTLAEVEPPHRIVERGRGGKFNRIRSLAVYTLSPAPGGITKLEFTFETQPGLPTDRLREALGGRRWVKRRYGRALRRLRSILEEDRERGRRATVAGR